MTHKTVVFDLDGTLVHSAPDLRAATNVALANLGRPALDLPTIISFVGHGVENLITQSLAATGCASKVESSQALADFMRYYERNMTTLTRPYPGVVDCLRDLQAAGFSLGICTNKPSGPARDICTALGLSEFFDVISGAEPDQPKKPDARPLLEVVAAMSAHPEQAIYVGDSAVDFHTARNAGLPFFLFNGGYLNDPLPDLSDSQRFEDWATFSQILKYP